MLETSLVIEKKARIFETADLSNRPAATTPRLDETDTSLFAQLTSQQANSNNNNSAVNGRIDALYGDQQSGFAQVNTSIANISSQQIPAVSAAVDSETARAQGAEGSLQAQITSLMANTDATALNSLAELVADYSQNGSGVTAALTAAVARIAQLEATVAALQNTRAIRDPGKSNP